ncbi:extracellular solute-binding protein [Cohnella sp. WQ 127256]|uniref:extracellular solute-binding protein n=1 Tax=Cohnella sp. WQ 127256 TaxID=2938790 RepID=UPI00211770B7|nr:extracellular solute-binding protein [Cohnella sp. WQ 127256]
MKFSFSSFVLLSMLLLGISGCIGGGGDKTDSLLDPLNRDKEVKLKVMYWDGSLFSKEYGMLFQNKFPNIDLEVASMSSLHDNPSLSYDEALEQFIAEKKPDVLLFFDDRFRKYAINGTLLELDTVIKQEKADFEGIHPYAINSIRDFGDGKLFGLSGEISSAALFYNIDLFTKYGVEFPKDSMTWEEVFELAKRFPTDGNTEERLYGLTTDNYTKIAQFIQQVGAAQNLKVLNADATQLTINTDSWKMVFQTVIEAAKSGTYFAPTDEDGQSGGSFMAFLKGNLFTTGRSAMAFKYSNEVQQIIDAKNMLKDVAPVNWGIVTAPVDPNNRTQSSYFGPGTIFAVNKSSANPRAAWEFVKYATSDEYAKHKSKQSYNGILSRMQYNSDKEGRSMEPFYKLEPKSGIGDDYSSTLPRFYEAFYALVNTEIDSVLSDKKSVEEALKTIQEKGQEELVKARQDQEAARKESSSPSASASP